MTQIWNDGDLVRVRRQRWRVLETRRHAQCSEVALAGAGAANIGLLQRVLVPFDRIEPVADQRRLKRARSRGWQHVCRYELAAGVPPDGLRGADGARIELRPHQLEPALAVANGRGTRLLLADAVGLGKTIQAGLVMAELRARGVASRVLVLAPSGLRDQWAAELAERFRLDATVVDAAELRRRGARLPMAVNPWTTVPIAVASVDYVKQAHVLPGVSACRWDVLIVDEAHGVSGDTERRSAVGALAAAAPYVLLLSATPHSGDRAQFRQLCDLGSHGDRVLIFRRGRRDVALPVGRKVRHLRVHIGPAERRMHAIVAAFGRAVRRDHGSRREIWLALAVLHKRALSTPFALRRSVERRLEALGRPAPATVDGPAQLELPWTDRDGEGSRDDDAPAWPGALALRSASHEASLLERLRSAALAATDESAKLDALDRLLRRVREPVIVFTEYRDTLEHVRRRLGRPAAVLHGGLARADRTRAVADFTSGRQCLLLATDAAAEGLNLQQRCRLVVNLELPWNPMRLEQRIGRVDRIGQARTVHAVHLIAAQTGEARLLEHLRWKVARARADIGSDDPLDGQDEVAIARLAISGLVSGSPSTVSPIPGEGGDAAAFAERARAEAARLEAVRQLLARAPRQTRRPLPLGPWLVRSRNRRTRERLGGRAVLFFRAALEDGTGRRMGSRLVPVVIAPAWPCFRSPESASAALAALAPELERLVDDAIRAWRARATVAHEAFVDAAIARTRRILEAEQRLDAPSLFQPDLFFRRAERQHGPFRPWTHGASGNASDRLARLVAGRVLEPRPYELLLVLTT